MKQSKKSLESKVYGRRAAEVLFEKRPQDIVRAYVTQDSLFHHKRLVKYCADKKLAYHIVESEELDNITKATHHEGVALIVKNKTLPTLEELFKAKGRSLILALDHVENPHNLGAIMRTAAHFGITGIVYNAKVPVAQSAAAVRTAEGGAESTPALHTNGWNETLQLAKKNNFQLLMTSSHGGTSLFNIKYPEKTLLFIGAEGEGLSDSLLKLGEKVQIPGTGNVESLNVSNATTALLTEWLRQNF